MGREVPITTDKIVAAFDFDGTIIRRDSLLVFIWFAVSSTRIVIGTIKTMPYLVLFFLKIIPNFKAKEKLFEALFKNIDIDDFNKTCLEFSDKIDAMVKPEAIDKIKWHKQMGHEIVIVSASVENWITPWAIKNGIKTVLATKIEIVSGKITGKFLSKNCHGAEKVSRLSTHFPDRKTYELYAYGDSNGDKDMLQFADHKFYRVF